MAEYIIQETTLTDIADAIREKDGSTDPIKVSDMATAISEIPSGGDIDTSALTTAHGSYFMSFPIYNFIKDNHLENNVVIVPISGYSTQGAYKYQYIDARYLTPPFNSEVGKPTFNDLSFVKFDCTGIDEASCIAIDLMSLSDSGSNSVMDDNYVHKLPTIVHKGNKKLFACSTSPLYRDSWATLYQSDVDNILSYLSNFDGLCDKNGKTSRTNIKPDAFCCGMRLLDNSRLADRVQELLDADRSIWSATVDMGTYGSFSDIRVYKIPVLHGTEINPKTGSAFNSFFNGSGSFTKTIKFCTDNGQPFAVKWKNQLIDLTRGNLGYGTSSGSYPAQYEYKQLATQTLGSNTTTIEEATAEYNAHKDDPYWIVGSSRAVTYDGKTINLAKLFSLYNHDSAVETINSLPDTSAYLAASGGTNTLKLARYSGALTDGGGCGDLTADEIAVATNKGWTITFAD